MLSKLGKQQRPIPDCLTGETLQVDVRLGYVMQIWWRDKTWLVKHLCLWALTQRLCGYGADECSPFIPRKEITCCSMGTPGRTHSVFFPAGGRGSSLVGRVVALRVKRFKAKIFTCHSQWSLTVIFAKGIKPTRFSLRLNMFHMLPHQ